MSFELIIILYFMSAFIVIVTVRNSFVFTKKRTRLTILGLVPVVNMIIALWLVPMIASGKLRLFEDKKTSQKIQETKP